MSILVTEESKIRPEKMYKLKMIIICFQKITNIIKIGLKFKL